MAEFIKQHYIPEEYLKNFTLEFIAIGVSSIKKLKMYFVKKFPVFEWRQKLLFDNKIVFPPELGNFRNSVSILAEKSKS